MGALFYMQKEVRTMNYVLRCEKCGRPAQLRKRATGRTPNGHLNVTKVYERVCPCGGAIKPTME